MINIFLTGEVGIGKSTFIEKTLALLPDVVYGGFRTISSAPITAEAMLDVFIESAWEKMPRDISHRVGTRWGDKRFTAYPEIFDSIGASVLAAPPANASLILMDELGVMESDAELFKSAVFDVLNSSSSVLGTIKPKQTDFLNAIRAHKRSIVFEINQQNRDSLHFRIANLLKDELFIDKVIPK
ncbi:MAG: hypothetical protein KBI01_02930 [Oscillospiraceae bacterium]|nr:hypothetical protein [Oscillospiraceae bacterium]